MFYLINSRGEYASQGHATLDAAKRDLESHPAVLRDRVELSIEFVEDEPTTPSTVDKISDKGKALRAAVAHAADVASAVDEIADELISKETGTVDLDNFHYHRIQDVQNALDELGKIILGDGGVCLLPAEAPHVQLLAESIDRARQIQAAVRETLASL